MEHVRAWAVLVVIVQLVGCSGGNSCIVGMSSPCACPDGRMGAQVCNASGGYDACVCSGGMDGGGQPPDAGQSDAGTMRDAGVDAGTHDAGMSLMDSGRRDAGMIVRDAGAPTGYVRDIPVDEARVLVSDVMGDLHPTADFTYELWVNFDRYVPGLRQYLLFAEGGTPTIGTIALHVDVDDNLECLVRASLGYWRVEFPNVSSQLPPGTWHHVLCTFGASQLSLFVDGNPVANYVVTSGTPRLPGPGIPLAIGGSSAPVPWPDFRFQGLID